MGVMKRVSLVFKAKANKALDKMEDPRETLDYSYQRQLELLTKVRRGVADVATSRKRVELQMNQLQQSANKLDDQARKALGMNREDLAREALIRKSSAQSQLNDLQAQYAQLQAEEEKLTVASQRLQAKVDAFRTRKETIKATYTAAEAQTRINEAFSGISEEMGDVGMAIQRAEDKTAQMQARAGAIDELMASGALDDLGGRRDDIQSELDQISAGSDVENELRRLRGEIAASAPKQLEGGANGDGQPNGDSQVQSGQASRPSTLRLPRPRPGSRSRICPARTSNRRTVRDCDRQDPGRGAVQGRRRGHRRAEPPGRRPRDGCQPQRRGGLHRRADRPAGPGARARFTAGHG